MSVFRIATKVFGSALLSSLLAFASEKLINNPASDVSFCAHAHQGGFSSHEVKRQIGEVNHGGRGLFRFW